MSNITTVRTNKAMFIIGALFFVFGFVTWVNSTLIPYLQIACELKTSEAVLVTFAFYISYAVMAFPSSWVLRKTGFKKGMMLGLIVMAAGALLFIPAAKTRIKCKKRKREKVREEKSQKKKPKKKLMYAKLK